MIRIFLLITILFSLTQSLFSKELELDDLGFIESEFTIDKKMANTLKKRNEMLTKHQYLALGALGLMTGGVLASGHGESTDTHKWLGIAGGSVYYAAAYHALAAPEVENMKVSGNSKWHRRLAWIHGPAMILTPILGHLANEKYKKGEQPTGLVKHHNKIALTGYFAFLASALTMTFEF